MEEVRLSGRGKKKIAVWITNFVQVFAFIQFHDEENGVTLIFTFYLNHFYSLSLPALTEFHLLGLNVSCLPVNNVTLKTLLRAKFLTFASFIFGSLSFSYITCCVLGFAACSNEKCCAGESQRLIIFLLLEFMRCIWGQLLPVCASAFLSAQCELSQRGEEGTPGRLLPPHQTCPLPLSVSPSSLPNVSHTAWVVLLPLFFPFCLFSHSFILSHPQTPTHSWMHARVQRRNYANACKIYNLIRLVHPERVPL